MPSRVDLPKDWDPKDPSYVTLEMIHTFFARFIIPHEPGTRYEYSNINLGLLGYLLALKEGRDLETVLKKKVLRPLGMEDTCVTLTDAQRRRLSKGYTSRSQESGYVNTPIPFSGGGSLKSNARDLMSYLERALGYRSSTMGPALSQQTRVIETADGPSRTVGYFHYPQPYGDVFLIRSRTFGFRCCMGLVPSRGVGVVVLGNCMRFETPEVFRKVLETVVAREAGLSGPKDLRGKKFQGGTEGAFDPMD
jgi:CubicO group peptidase (beta-lactamase class C family)